MEILADNIHYVLKIKLPMDRKWSFLEWPADKSVYLAYACLLIQASCNW